MADYWKSNERKYCDFCKCWISDNKASVSFHENGKRHKLNVAKRITDISRSSAKAEQEKRQMDQDIRRMEDAAMRSYAGDIHSRGDFTARNISTVMAATSTAASTAMSAAGAASQRQVDPMRLPGNSDDEDECGGRVGPRKVQSEDVPNASLWVEGKSDEGYTYYWNVKTNESVWTAPKEGFLSYAEYERINDIAVRQQELQEANDAKKFRDNADEEVARYNRERLKRFRRPETAEEKEAKRLNRELNFRTEEEVAATPIGEWQTVVVKPPPAPIDWELPQTADVYVPPVVKHVDTPAQPVKRFKEKMLPSGLDPEVTSGTSTTFKKRKFAAKGNARQRLDND